MMIQLLFLIMQSLNMRTLKHNMMKSLPQQNAAANMPQVKDELDKCIADEEAKKKQWKMLLQMR